MKTVKHFIAALLLITMVASSPGANTFSGSRGSSSFSSGSSGSGSRSAAPSAPAPSRSWGSSSSNSGKTSSGWGGSSAPKLSTSKSSNSSSTDSAISAKSAMTNSVSRQQTVEQYKTQNATKYTNRFSNEPPTRPTYIPQQYVDPVQHTYHYVYYDRGYGGYGYWDLMGQFILYDALTEHANRYADTQTQAYASDEDDAPISFPHWLKLFMIIVLAVIIFAVLGVFIASRNSAY